MVLKRIGDGMTKRRMRNSLKANFVGNAAYWGPLKASIDSFVEMGINDNDFGRLTSRISRIANKGKDTERIARSIGANAITFIKHLGGYEDYDPIVGYIESCAVSDKIGEPDFAYDIARKSTDLLNKLISSGNANKENILSIFESARTVRQDYKELADRIFSKGPEILVHADRSNLQKIASKAREVEETHSDKFKGMGSSLIDRTPEILKHLGYEGFEKIADLITKPYDHDEEENLVTFVKGIPKFIQRQLDRMNRDTAIKVYDIVNRIAEHGRTGRITALHLLGHSTELIKSFGYENFEKVAETVRSAAEAEDQGKYLEETGLALALATTATDIQQRLGYSGFETIAGLAMKAAEKIRELHGHQDVILKYAAGILEKEEILRLKKRKTPEDDYDEYEIVQTFIPGNFVRNSPGVIDDLLTLEKIDHEKALNLYQTANYCENWDVGMMLIKNSKEIIKRIGYDIYMEDAAFFNTLKFERRACAVSAINNCPAIVDSLGHYGFQAVVTLANTGSVKDANIFLIRSKKIISGLLRLDCVGKEEVLDIYSIALDMAEEDYKAAFKLVYESPTKLK